MRHRKQKGKLSRDAAQRKALYMNPCREVIDHERIQTTEAKAKAVKPELERLITLAKRGDGHSRRLAMARLGQDKFVVYKLFEEIAPRYSDREGGYTRISLGPRKSDSTEMVFLELVRRDSRRTPVRPALGVLSTPSGLRPWIAWLSRRRRAPWLAISRIV